MAKLFETFMLLCFGAAWPANILKSYRVRTAKGKSLFFLIIVDAGYICGILAKVLSGKPDYVIFFYCLNFVMVAVDIVLYFRNAKLDKPQK